MDGWQRRKSKYTAHTARLTESLQFYGVYRMQTGNERERRGFEWCYEEVYFNRTYEYL